MKRMQGLEIGRKWFRVEEMTARESANMIDAYSRRYKYSDIYAAYQTPSNAKVSIWNEWVEWANYVNMLTGTYEVKDLSICDTTCQTFTACAIIREFDEDEIGNYLPVATYIMIATKYHNYLYRLASDED